MVRFAGKSIRSSTIQYSVRVCVADEIMLVLSSSIGKLTTTGQRVNIVQEAL